MNAQVLALPDDLTERDQWVCWRTETRNGKGTKIPYQPNNKPASVTDPATWRPYTEVCDIWQQSPGTFTGIGYVFSPEDPFAGIDLDNCRKSGELMPWARPIVERFADTYMEVSPSGNGIKIFAKGRLGGRGKRKQYEDHAVEIYDRGRFFTVTARVLNGAPLQLEDHQADIDELYETIAGVSTSNGHAQKIEAKIPQGQRHNTLVSLAGTMRRRGMGVEAIDAALWAENCTRCEPLYDRQHIRKIAESTAGWTPEPGSPTPDLLGYLHNDHGNASRLIVLSGEDLRYCHAFKKWLVWDRRRWAVDETDQVRRSAKHAMLELLKQALDKDAEEAAKFARSCLDARRISSMLVMAECEIYVQPGELDRNPHLLNFRNGTVDLRTSELRPHRREDYISKLIHYDYLPGATCARWLAFLDEVMAGGPDTGQGAQERAARLMDYLQRALGYSLTGCTIEKAVFVLFGDGDNGKSTMLSTFRQLVPEYSVLLQAETLMVRQENNNSQADLADLRGARFVQTSETEEGQRLAQGKLKRITQGMGTIKAVRKYENPIEFAETHKLWMDTNRKPTIRDADDAATFNRLHPIPFTVRIPKERIDKDLPAKLLAEAEGILAWAVAGAKLWYESGLKKPIEVKAANDEWRSEMDQLGRFIEECCVVGNQFTVQAAALYGEYKRYCEESGERTITATAFGRKLTEKGLEKRHLNSGAQYQHIGLKSKGAREAND